MATGARLAGLLASAATLYRSPVVGEGGLIGTDTPRFGPLTSHQPIAIRSIAGTAQRQRSFFDDWYNRVHVTPTLIEFGVVASNITREVHVWNAYLGPTTIGSLLIQTGSDITINGPTLPRALQQFQSATFEVTAAGDGSATIDSNVLFNFSDRDDVPRVKLTGTRSRLFDFRPNWKDSVEVSHAYRTDIFKSRSGKEQRRALRGDPRKTVEFTIGIYEDKLRAFQRLMARWQSRPVTMGDPTRHVPTIAVAPPNTSTLHVADEPRWLTPGTTVMLEYGDARELRVVESVTFGVITFVTPGQLGWGVGTSVRPVLSGLLDADMSATHLSDGVAEVKISLAVDPGSEPVFVTDAGLLIHNGREVLPFAPNWSESVSTQYAWQREQVDFGFGRIQSSTPVNFSTQTRKAAFLGRTATDAQAIEDFFHRAKGQRGEFYWPSGLNDLPLAAALVQGGDSLRTPGVETFEDYADDTVFRAVAVTLRDDRVIYRTIQGMTQESGDTIVQFTSPWLFDIPVSDVVRVSWLTAARFASDQFSAEWMTNEVVQTQLAVQTLEDLTVEAPVFTYDGAAQWVLENWGADAGLRIMDRFDWLVNVLYPAIFFIPEAWVRRGEADVDRFDVLINVTYPAIFD